MANQYDTNLKLQAIADAIGDSSSSGLIQALEDIADAVAGGGGGSSAGLVSDNFSETDTYDLGDYCIHNNTLYVCINAITTPGAWDLSDWQATNAGLELSSLNSAIPKLLWTNPNPAASMSDYTISIDLSNYDAVTIYTTEGAIETIVGRSVYGVLEASSSNVPSIYRRVFGTSTTGITVTKCLKIALDGGSTVEDSGTFVPLKVVGIKFN